MILVSVAFVLLTGMRPAYDAYGWLVWGRQTVHLNLDLNAAPSWKPLPFLFTLPYSLIPGQAALWLWMVTAVAGAFAGSVFAARIAYRLSAPAHRYARVAGAVFAAVGVLGIAGYWHFVLIATSDPLMTTLCLAAIDAHLSGRRRLAWALLVLASLGRPEAWLVTAAYALWAWRSDPALRTSVLVGLAAIPLLWFGIPTITSGNPLIAGKIEADSTVALPGNRVTGTLDGFTSLYELPMWIAALAAILLAAVRRERTWIVLIGAALLWLLTEIAFALHGWAPSPRYMFEPVAVLVVLVGAGIGRVLSVGPAPLRAAALGRRGGRRRALGDARPAGPNARATRSQRDRPRADVGTTDRPPAPRDRRCRRPAARPRLRQAGDRDQVPEHPRLGDERERRRRWLESARRGEDASARSSCSSPTGPGGSSGPSTSRATGARYAPGYGRTPTSAEPEPSRGRRSAQRPPRPTSASTGRHTTAETRITDGHAPMR